MTERIAEWDDFFEARLGAVPVLVILRGHEPDATVRLCERAVEAGVATVEVPIQDEKALSSLDAAVTWSERSGAVVGAGTVTTVERVNRAADAGARFTVAPGVDAEVVRRSRERGIPHVPGVATGTEIQRALSLGCVWQKAFPASLLGAEWITAMLGPFPEVRFVATGGVSAANGQGFLDAGASAVALGSSFADARSTDVQALQRTPAP